MKNLERIVLSRPRRTLAAVALATAVLASRLGGLRVVSDFSDLLPQGHPLIQVHNEIRDLFGGANLVTFELEVESGDLFTAGNLDLLHRLTQEADLLPGVQHQLVSSLTHRNVRKVAVTETGGMRSQPYYDPQNPPLTTEALARLKADVQADPFVLGTLVSPDLKAALVRAQFPEKDLDYETLFAKIQDLRARLTQPGIRIRAVGNPVLIGWVHSHLRRVVPIALGTLLLMAALLAAYFRRLYGVLLPLAGVLLSAVWGLGFQAWMIGDIDPLNLVIPFLLSASVMCHGIQILSRFFGSYDRTGDAPEAARAAFRNLLLPGATLIAADVLGVLINLLGSTPSLKKLAIGSALWAASGLVTVFVALPALLCVLPPPRKGVQRGMKLFRSWTAALGRRLARPRVARGVLVSTGALAACGVAVCFLSRVGRPEPGSSLLYSDHDYNVSARAIDARFPGTDELYIEARSDEPGGLKRSETLLAIEDFERAVLAGPGAGGVKGLPGLIRQVNRLTHDGDPRWAQIPSVGTEVGGLLFAYMASSPVSGALKEFIDPDEQNANLVFYFKDHKPGTALPAIARARAWIAGPGRSATGLTMRLAGGGVGVAAACYEALAHDEILIVPLALALAFFLVVAAYHSLHAGWLMLLPTLFGTVMVQAFMALHGISIDVNTIPVIAVGVGVGDYALYLMGRVREELRGSHSVEEAVARAIETTGAATLFSVVALAAGVVLWPLFSDWKFPAESAILVIMQLSFDAIGTLLIVPSWILVVRPAFLSIPRSKAGR